MSLRMLLESKNLDSTRLVMATPYSLQVYEEVRSTQDVAAAGFAGRPLLVVAGRQTEGRGRSSRAWESAPRAMAASLAFRPSWEIDSWPRIPLVAGLAAAKVLGPGISLKWPNDVLLGEEKVGGILAEGSGDVLVVGCGLNLWWPDAPEGIGARWADDPGPDSVVVTATAWADGFLQRLRARPEDWGRSEYLALSGTVGRTVTWEPAGRGKAIDIGEEGSLIVETETGSERLIAGEVRHLRAV